MWGAISDRDRTALSPLHRRLEQTTKFSYIHVDLKCFKILNKLDCSYKGIVSRLQKLI